MDFPAGVLTTCIQLKSRKNSKEKRRAIKRTIKYYKLHACMDLAASALISCITTNQSKCCYFAYNTKNRGGVDPGAAKVELTYRSAYNFQDKGKQIYDILPKSSVQHRRIIGQLEGYFNFVTATFVLGETAKNFNYM